jgi:hypothetical protein
MAKVDESDVDCDFLGFARLVPQPMDFRDHFPSFHHLDRWYMDGQTGSSSGKTTETRRDRP